MAIGQKIIDSNSIQAEIESTKLLAAFFDQSVLNKKKLPRQNETIVTGGIALSSFDAAVCINDYLRTARFIKGIYKAIKELIKRFPAQKINILYAGCGPYATLLLPLLPLFNKRALQIMLIDINEHSIASVKKNIALLNLEDYIIDTIIGDAVSYKKPASWPLHLVVAEAMFEALIREPQVRVTANLAPQIEKNGLLIPQEIIIDLACAFFSKQPYYKTNDLNNIKNILPEYYKIDTLFTLDKSSHFAEQIENSIYRFESTSYKKPADMQHYPDICIFTYVRVFKDILLDTGESLITNPHCITAITNLNKPDFKLTYDFKDIPKWNYQ